jgi:Bacteriophage head to tail connecting protein
MDTVVQYSGDNLTRRQRALQLWAALKLERWSFDSHWMELGTFLKPRRTRFQTTDKNKGDRRNQNIIDSSPLFALRTLQSGLHAGLTSPARPWVKLTIADADLAEFPSVKRWLHTVTSRMLTIFAKSNLYNALPTLYGDIGGFGTGALGILDDGPDLMRSYCYPLGSYVVGLDDRGVATTFMREYQLTVRQVIQQFGKPEADTSYGRGSLLDRSKFSRRVLDAWDRGRYEENIEVVWCVQPNDQHDARKLQAKYRMPWSSYYFEVAQEKDHDCFLRESGFEQFPIMVPRWDVTGEDTYGTDCPGMIALGDTKALQIMHRRKAKAVDKSLDPPLQGPSHLRTERTSLNPGEITYIDDAREKGGLRPIHEVRLEGVEWLVTDIQEYERRINRAFYADLFQMLAMSDGMRGAQPITAEEVRARQEEKLIVLGPVLERTNDELLDPLVDRVFAMMLRAGGIPPPPEELGGMDLKVEYISVLAQAQKLVGIVGQDRYLQSAMTLAQVWPEAKHKVNVFQALDAAAAMLGVNPEVNRTDDEAQASLEAEQQAAASAAQAEQLKTMAQAGQALGNTPMQNGGNALQAVLDGVGAQ